MFGQMLAAMPPGELALTQAAPSPPLTETTRSKK